jgi:H/ACA ribonucleoprotein complex subunit 4
MSKRPAWEITREIRVKAEEETNPDYGCLPEDRPLNDYIRYGMVVIDKTAGPTSHEVAAWIKKLLELDKVGHGGTLDPKVTGILPTMLQESTKAVQALLDAGKEYVTVMRTHEDVSEAKIREALDLFTGELYQRPPLRSSVSRRLRTRYIYNIDFHEGEGRNWLFTVACQSGTYIRKLCFDIGEVLGCGAHMQELRRSRSGPFTEDDLYTLYDLSEAVDLRQEGDDSRIREIVRPYEDAMALLPKICIRDTAVEAICTGAQLAIPGVLNYETGINEGDLIGVMTQKNEAVALMRADMSSGKLQSESNGIAATTVRVLMPNGVYPRSW